MADDFRDVKKIIINTGRRGSPGASAYEAWLNNGNTGTVEDFLESLVGKSAYKSWLETGHAGTEEDFVNWIKGVGLNLYIQDTMPVDAEKFLWLQTGYCSADGFTLWFEDGT